MVVGGRPSAASSAAPRQRRSHANVDRVFRLEEIVEAHRSIEENRATGKVRSALDARARPGPPPITTHPGGCGGERTAAAGVRQAGR
jgi:hypothetical protein